MSFMSEWFVQRRGLANGIMSAGRHPCNILSHSPSQELLLRYLCRWIILPSLAPSPYQPLRHARHPAYIFFYGSWTYGSCCPISATSIAREQNSRPFPWSSGGNGTRRSLVEGINILDCCRRKYCPRVRLFHSVNLAAEYGCFSIMNEPVLTSFPLPHLAFASELNLSNAEASLTLALLNGIIHGHMHDASQLSI